MNNMGMIRYIVISVQVDMTAVVLAVRGDSDWSVHYYSWKGVWKLSLNQDWFIVVIVHLFMLNLHLGQSKQALDDWVNSCHIPTLHH